MILGPDNTFVWGFNVKRFGFMKSQISRLRLSVEAFRRCEIKRCDLNFLMTQTHSIEKHTHSYYSFENFLNIYFLVTFPGRE